MNRLLSLVVLVLWAPLALALSPYYYGNRLPAGDLTSLMANVQKSLEKQGLSIVGKYVPSGLGGQGVLVATDKDLLAAVRAMGGASIVGAPIRVGVKSDGTVSFVNLEYWNRAYFRKQYPQAEKAIRNAHARLVKALGGGKKTFGGDVAKADLADYQYMFGMEGFDSDKNLLLEHLSFDDAVNAIRENLAAGVANTAKVYEIVMPDKNIAVFGVALNDPREGEGAWVKVIGVDNVPALPYEVYVVNNRANHLFARFRIALGWPDVGMGSFMRIVETPGNIRDTLVRVAGGTP